MSLSSLTRALCRGAESIAVGILRPRGERADPDHDLPAAGRLGLGWDVEHELIAVNLNRVPWNLHHRVPGGRTKLGPEGVGRLYVVEARAGDSQPGAVPRHARDFRRGRRVADTVVPRQTVYRPQTRSGAAGLSLSDRDVEHRVRRDGLGQLEGETQSLVCRAFANRRQSRDAQLVRLRDLDRPARHVGTGDGPGSDARVCGGVGPEAERTVVPAVSQPVERHLVHLGGDVGRVNGHDPVHRHADGVEAHLTDEVEGKEFFEIILITHGDLAARRSESERCETGVVRALIHLDQKVVLIPLLLGG